MCRRSCGHTRDYRPPDHERFLPKNSAPRTRGRPRIACGVRGRDSSVPPASRRSGPLPVRSARGTQNEYAAPSGAPPEAARGRARSQTGIPSWRDSVYQQVEFSGALDLLKPQTTTMKYNYEALTNHITTPNL